MVLALSQSPDHIIGYLEKKMSIFTAEWIENCCKMSDTYDVSRNVKRYGCVENKVLFLRTIQVTDTLWCEAKLSETV